MCRIPKVVIVAPPERHLELRRALSSLEYDVAAAVPGVEDASTVTADIAVVVDPSQDDLDRLRATGLKTVAVGGAAEGADMVLQADELPAFKTRIWELFRPA